MQIAGYRFEQLEQQLYSAVIADILDDLGYRDQTLDPALRPLNSTMAVAGRAFTVMAVEVDRIPEQPYRLQMEAVDLMKPGDIFTVSAIHSAGAAFWGELLSIACRARGGRGAIVDGLNRDSGKIAEMNFPLFSRGQRPTDSKGRLDVVAYQTPLNIGGVWVQPGDFLFGDVDGLVVVPQAIEEEVIAKAMEKVDGENQVRKALQEGMLCSEAFRTFGIL